MGLYVKDKVVATQLKQYEITEEISLLELIKTVDLPEITYDAIDICVNNGNPIKREQWDLTIVDNTDVVMMSIMPRDEALGLVAMIALAYFAGPMAGSMLGAGASSGAVGALSSGIMFVGSLAINALFAPPAPKSQSNQDDSAGFAAISGVKNTPRPYSAVRNVLGEYEVTPDIAVEPYVVTTGDTQTIYAIYDFGYGTMNVSNIKIGNTPISSYKDVRYKIHNNYTDGALQYYVNDNVNEQFNAEINSQWTTRTVATPDTNAVTIGVNFPMGLATIHERRGPEPTPITFNIEYKKPGGNWKPYTNAAYFGTSHPVSGKVVSEASYMTFSNLYYHVGAVGYGGYSLRRTGGSFQVETRGATTSNQYHIPQALSPRVGQSFNLGDGIKRTITGVWGFSKTTRSVNIGNNDVSSVNFNSKNYTSYGTANISFSPALAYSSHRYPDTRTRVTETILDYTWSKWVWGTTRGTSFAHLSKSQSRSFILTRTATTPFIFTIDLAFDEAAEYQIRIATNVRFSYLYNDRGDDKYLNKSDLVNIVSKSYRKPLHFDVPHTILEVKIRSTKQLSGVVDTLSAYCKRQISTYNDGIPKFEFSENPAWIAYYILTGSATPNPIATDRIDLDAFISWAKFCDEISVHGDVKYEIDMNMDAESTVQERLNSVLSVGRATLAYRDNKYSVIFDEFPVISTQLFTEHNYTNFKASKTFIDTPHAIRVNYIDRTNNWQMTEVVVYSDGYDASNSNYYESLSLPNVTQYNQAWRAGRYYLAQGILRKDIVTIDTYIDNLRCERGDLVGLQSSAGLVGGVSSRIVAIDNTFKEITLSEGIINEPNTSLEIRYQDGNISTTTVLSYIGSHTVVLDTAVLDANVGDLCVWGDLTAEMLVKSITPSDNLSATLELIPIARDIENADTGTIPDYTPLVGQSELGRNVEPISSLVDVLFYYNNRKPLVDLSLSWVDLGAGISYEIWVSEYNDDHYTYVDTVFEKVSKYMIYDHQSTIDADYRGGSEVAYKVIPVNVYGSKANFDETIETVIELPHDTTAPSKPQFFSGNIIDQTINLTWLPPVDEDIGGYILKYYPETSGGTWLNSVIDEALIPFNATSISVNARIGSYLIKTIDTSGNISEDFSLVKTTIPHLETLENIFTLDENPSFSGLLNNLQHIDSGIALSIDGSRYSRSGTYNFNNVADLGAIERVFISAKAITGFIDNVMISSWETLAEVDKLVDAKESDLNVIVQVRMTNHMTVLDDWGVLDTVDPIGDPLDEEWSGWQTLTAGFYTGRKFQFRSVLSSIAETVSPSVLELGVKFERQQRTIRGDNIVAPIAGTDVVFDRPFALNTRPVISITEDDSVSGNYYNLTNIDNYKFHIQFFDKTDTSIEAQFDYHITGVGEILDQIYEPVIKGEDESNNLPDAMNSINNLLI